MHCLTLMMCFFITTTLVHAQSLPPALPVVDNQLQTADGQTVWLQGINVPSLEWMPEGENVLRSTDVAITGWNANMIRLPLSQCRWFGHGERQSDGGAAYRKLVDDVLAMCVLHGAYLVLDLHWSNSGQWGKHMQQKHMPNQGSMEFWIDVAKRYANHPAVLFDLYNEPRDVTWEVWRNGRCVPNDIQNLWAHNRSR